MDSVVNELEAFEEIILKDMADFVKHFRVTPLILMDFKIEVEILTNEMKNRLIVGLNQNKGNRKCYIQYHQQALVELAGHLTEYAPPQKITGKTALPKNEILCHYLFVALEELLTFLEKQFSKYFNQDTWVCPGYRMLMAVDFEKSIQPLEQALAKHKIEPELVKVVLYPFRQFMNDPPTKGTTYRQVIFVKKLKYKLLEKLKSPGNKNAMIRDLLLYLNFNNVFFFEYCTARFVEVLKKASTMEEQFEQLALLKKKVSQAPTKPKFAYDANREAIQQQLLHWLEQEDDYLEKKHQLLACDTEGAPWQTAPGADKIKTNLSVAQLAYLMHLLVEERIVEEHNIAGLLRTTCQTFTTKRREQLSFSSIQNKYYEVERSTKEAVKTMLLKMAENADHQR